MPKGLCPGVGRSLKKESVEKAGRERERPIFLGVHGKPIKPFHRTCTAHEGTGFGTKNVRSGVRVGEVQKKNKTGTLQEQITFNEARRGSSQISELLNLSEKRVYTGMYVESYWGLSVESILRGPVLFQGYWE